ncbi:hypothetical protein H8E52_09130 [bacterium]|nr:hypothetical protein [bacterium]
MEKLRKLPSTPGIANPLGKSHRDRPKGKDEENLEQSRKQRKRREPTDDSRFELESSETDPRDQAPEENERGQLLDEKA